VTTAIVAAVSAFWGVLQDMAPYLLFGFLAAGLLSVLIPARAVERHLGGRGPRPVLKAALFGIPLPLCSCSVIPVAASLRKHGASRGATSAFLISTPQTGVDSILVTLSLLGPLFAVFRSVAAFVSGVVGGAVIGVVGRDDPDDAVGATCTDECCSPVGSRSILSRILRYGFVTLARDLAKPLLVGLGIAGVIAALVPSDYFSGVLGGGIVAMVVMLLVGIPVYVCATASVPVAAALIGTGVSPGAALVFLMTGPVTNAAAISMTWKVMGKRAGIAYLGTVALTALGAGLLLDHLLVVGGQTAVVEPLWELPAWVKLAASLVLLLVLGAALVGRPGGPVKGTRARDTSGGIKEYLVSGVTCSSCAEALEEALGALGSVERVAVDPETGEARVVCTGLDTDSVDETVRRLGCSLEEVEHVGT
jgi:uncharacterized membrane protein YraQ (UPF0718 family)/copper chaperone CopZ